MNCHGVARSTILLGMELRIQAEYSVVDHAKTLWQKLASALKSKLKLNIFEIGKTFGASSYRNSEMSTTMYRGLIGKSTIDISVPGHQPPALMLPTPTLMSLQRQSPRWVSKSASSTSFAGSQGMTSGKASWSSWSTKMPQWPPPLMRSSPSLLKRKLQSKERMGSLQKLCSLQRRVAKVVLMVVKPVKAAKVQSGIREIIRVIGKRRIRRSGFIASGDGISPRTAWASNAAIPQLLLTLQQKHQMRPLWHSPHRSRTIGWWPAQMLHTVIGSLIADARVTSPAIDQCSSPTLNMLPFQSRRRDTMGSHHFHPDMRVLGWFASCQMERRKRYYFKKWCMCRDRSMSSHSLGSWTRTSKLNWSISTASTSTIAIASWLPLLLRSMGNSFWIKLQNRPNTPISTTASCWHLWWLGMHPGTMQRSGWYSTAAGHTSVSRLGRSCQRSPMLRDWPASAIARVASNANWRDNPSLPTWLPVPLSLCSSCTRTYAVPWQQPLEEVDRCCSSLTTPCGMQMRTYRSTSRKPRRNWKNGRLLERRCRASKWTDFVQMEAVSIPPRNSQNT